jgi:hypothetical protein
MLTGGDKLGLWLDWRLLAYVGRYSSPARTAKAAGEACEEGPLMSKPYYPGEVERRIRALWRS